MNEKKQHEIEKRSETVETDSRPSKASRGANVSSVQANETRDQEDFSCHHALNPGTLHVTGHGVVFDGSSSFLFQRRIELRWEDVEKVDSKENETTGGNSSTTYSVIVFITATKSYEFTQFSNFSRARSVITSFHHQAVINPLHSTSSSPLVPTVSSPTLNRSNTEPIMSSGTVENSKMAAAKAIFAAAFESGPAPEYRIEDEDPEDDQDTKEDPAMTAGDTLEDVDEWNEIKTTTRKDFPSCPVMNRRLPCNVDSFLEKFIANDSDFLPSYMTGRGCKEMTASPWVLDDDLLWQKRSLNYIRPINAPLAPPTALARKEQRFRTYGNHGICVETRTYTEGVPVSDCFHIKDRILVEPISGSDEEDAVQITSYFRICFTKSSMFQAVVTTTSGSEISKFLIGLVDQMGQTLTGDTEKKPPATMSQTRVTEQQPQVPRLPTPSPILQGVGPIQVYIIIGMLAVLFILQYQLTCQMKTIQQSLEILKQQLQHEQLKQICSVE